MGEQEVVDLGVHEVRAEAVEVVPIGLAEVLDLHPVLLGGLGELMVELGVVDEQLLLGGDGLQDEIALDVGLGLVVDLLL